MPDLLDTDTEAPPRPLLDLIPPSLPVAVIALAGAAVGLCAIVAGLLLGSWLVPLVLLGGLALVPVVLREPAWAAVVLVFVELSGLNDAIGSVGGVSLHLAALGLAALAVVVGWRQGTIKPFWSPVFLLYVVFIAIQGVTYLSAFDRSLVAGVVVDGLRTFIFLMLLSWIMVSRGRITRVAAVGVACVAALCLLSAASQYGFGNSTTFFGLSGVTVADIGGATQRHTGPLTDSNFWARQVVLFIPLALSLWTVRRFKVLRWVWLVAAASCMFGVYLSGSRGGLLATGVAILVWFLFAGRLYRRLLLLAPIAALLIVIVPGLGSRLATVTQVGTALAGEQADPSLEGRVAALEVGLHMIVEHPLLGVGAGNFEAAEPDYLRRYSIVSAEVWAPHNLYLQMAAETGALGFLAWAAFFLSALGTGVWAWWRAGTRLPERFADSHAMLALGVWVGLLAWAVASFFLHLAQVRALLIVVALGLALERRIRARTEDLPVERGRTARRWQLLFVGRPWRVVLAMALLVASVGAGFVVATDLAWVDRAEVSLVVSPRTQEDSYELDLLSRGQVPATYATIMADPEVLNDAASAAGIDADEMDDYSVVIQQPRQSAVVQIGVTGPDPGVSMAFAQAIAARATVVVDQLETTFVLEPVEHSARMQSSPDPMGRLWILGGAVVGLLLAALVLLRSLPAGMHELLGRRRRRRSEVRQKVGEDDVEPQATVDS